MHSLRFARILLSALLVVFFLSGAPLCHGQSFTANLSGVVTDPQNAVIPNVSIELRNAATNEVRTTKTGPDGRYVVSQLLPGTYELTAKAQGFKTYTQRDIILLANRSAELSLAMQVGDISQTVEVAGGAVLLDTESANVSVTLGAFQITRLPMSMRTPLALMTAMAGVTQVAADDIFTGNGQVFDQQYSRFAMNGGRGHSAMILLDGATNTAGDWSGLMISPIVDSVQ